MPGRQLYARPQATHRGERRIEKASSSIWTPGSLTSMSAASWPRWRTITRTYPAQARCRHHPAQPSIVSRQVHLPGLPSCQAPESMPPRTSKTNFLPPRDRHHPLSLTQATAPKTGAAASATLPRQPPDRPASTRPRRPPPRRPTRAKSRARRSRGTTAFPKAAYKRCCLRRSTVNKNLPF